MEEKIQALKSAQTEFDLAARLLAVGRAMLAANQIEIELSPRNPKIEPGVRRVCFEFARVDAAEQFISAVKQFTEAK